MRTTALSNWAELRGEGAGCVCVVVAAEAQKITHITNPKEARQPEKKVCLLLNLSKKKRSRDVTDRLPKATEWACSEAEQTGSPLFVR